jgi:BirA family biotin operon repressor/biotin-[acetyl-CoA-carboxylase] ligase
VGARLASALRATYEIPVALKWPNDLLVAEDGGPARKLAGVLTDEVASPTLGRAVVAGIGLNVRLHRSSLPFPLGERIAALEEFVSPPPALEDVETMAVAAALGAAEWLANAEGASRARALCRELLYGVGRRASVDGRPAGTIESLGEDGELWVTTGTDRMAIWAGDVRVEELE